VSVDRTLLEGDPPPQLAPVDVMPQLKAALSDPGNWVGQLPAGMRPLVTVHAPAGDTGVVSLHPLGTLAVKQGVVPLDLEISRFGQSTPSGARLFSITSVSVGGQNETPQPVKDAFAPAQFLDLSDAEKLSRPSFEQMNAGVSFGSADFTFTDNSGDWLQVPEIEFETILIDKDSGTSRPSGSANNYQLTAAHLASQSRFGAAAGGQRLIGAAKYRTTTDKYLVVKEGWSIIATTDMTVQPPPGVAPKTTQSYSDAEQSMRAIEAANPAKAGGLTILRLSELAVP